MDRTCPYCPEVLFRIQLNRVICNGCGRFAGYITDERPVPDGYYDRFPDQKPPDNPHMITAPGGIQMVQIIRRFIRGMCCGTPGICTCLRNCKCRCSGCGCG